AAQEPWVDQPVDRTPVREDRRQRCDLFPEPLQVQVEVEEDSEDEQGRDGEEGPYGYLAADEGKGRRARPGNELEVGRVPEGQDRAVQVRAGQVRAGQGRTRQNTVLKGSLAESVTSQQLCGAVRRRALFGRLYSWIRGRVGRPRPGCPHGGDLRTLPRRTAGS